MGPGQPVNVNMNLDALLPAVQEMNGRLETIAQLLTDQGKILVDGEERQRELGRIQQRLVNLQDQALKRPPPHQEAPAQNDQVVATLNEILQTLQHAQASPVPASGQSGDQTEGILQLLQDIKERLGDLATGVPASKDEYLDQQREKLVEDIYSKMQPTATSPAQAPRATSRRRYSNMEGPTSPESRSRGTPSSRIPESPGSRPAQVPPPTLPEVDPKVAGKMDAIFAEEEEYLDEQKAHFEQQEKYLAERKEHLAQKKAWYLNIG